MTYIDPMTLLVASYVVPTAAVALTAWAAYLGATATRVPVRSRRRR